MNESPSPKVKQLAIAISKAEGFGVPNALPTRCHNPGDLELGNKGWGTDAGKTIFPDDETGWNALYFECALMLAGLQSLHRSHVYNVSQNFFQVARLWTGGDNAAAWARTVAQNCGVRPEQTLDDFLNANTQGENA